MFFGVNNKTKGGKVTFYPFKIIRCIKVYNNKEESNYHHLGLK